MFVRGAIFGLSAFLVFGALQVWAQWNPGGKFGEILSKILASGNWQEPKDGKVKDAAALGGVSADKFQQLGTKRSCAPNQCVSGFEANGDVRCTSIK